MLARKIFLDQRFYLQGKGQAKQWSTSCLACHCRLTSQDFRKKSQRLILRDKLRWKVSSNKFILKIWSVIYRKIYNLLCEDLSNRSVSHCVGVGPPPKLEKNQPFFSWKQFCIMVPTSLLTKSLVKVKNSMTYVTALA